jgi:hypothetical protein
VATIRSLSRRELTAQTIRRLREPARAREGGASESKEGKGIDAGPRGVPRDVQMGKEKEVLATGRLVDV